MMGDSAPLSDTAVLSFDHSSKQVLFSKLAKGSDSMGKDPALDQNSGKAGQKKTAILMKVTSSIQMRRPKNQVKQTRKKAAILIKIANGILMRKPKI